MPEFCPRCGNKLQFSDAEICPSCGVRVIPSQNGFKYLFYSLVMLGVLLILIYIIFIAFFPGNDKSLSSIKPAEIYKENNGIISSLDWVWHRDGWGDWQYSSSWTGPEVGMNSEYGPVSGVDYGEYGVRVNLTKGSTESSIWKTFTDYSGTGWNTVTLDGCLSNYTNRPVERWIKIDVIGENGKGDLFRTASERPPGNGERFTIKCHFPTSKNVTVKISHGQMSAYCTQFSMKFYSVSLSYENQQNSDVEKRKHDNFLNFFEK